MRRITVFDMDGTLTGGQSQQLLLDILRQQGLVDAKDYLLVLAWFTCYRLGLGPDAGRVRAFAYSRLKGITAKSFDDVVERFFDRFKSSVYDGAWKLVERHHAQGDDLVLMSASIEPIVRRIAALFSIPTYFCTKLKVCDGLLNGEIDGLAPYGQVRVQLLREHIAETYTDRPLLTLYSDHHSDIPLLSTADIPVCVNPDRKLRRYACANDWQIVATC